MEVNENMRTQNICPLCGLKCEEFGPTDKWFRGFNCPNCKEFTTEYYNFSQKEKLILSQYFSQTPNDDPLRKKIITKDNYKEIINHIQNK